MNSSSTVYDLIREEIGSVTVTRSAKKINQELLRIDNCVSSQLKGTQISNSQNKYELKLKPKSLKLKEKQFVPRNSLYTDLLHLPQFSIFYRSCIAVLLTITINAAARDLKTKGTITLGFDQLPDGLTNFHMAVLIWICMFLSTVAVYGIFLLWANLRVKFCIQPNSIILKLIDYSWPCVFGFYCISLIYVTIKSVVGNSLQLTISIVVLLEMLRIVMKIYAFVRSNTPRVISYKPHDEDKVLFPNFSQFLYFSFAPTLVYRDTYPRTTHIRWNFVALCGAEFLGVSLCLHLLQQYYVIPSFNIGKETLNWQDISLIMMENAIPCLAYWICLHYIIIHASQNAFAELLRFADRQFYGDWWNSASHGQFHRSWNYIVQDWLYFYVYKDMQEIVLPNNKVAAKAVVFFISAAFHEVLYGFAIRFFCPLGFISHFILSFPLTYLKKQTTAFHIFFLYTLALGFGILTCGQMLEYHVRLHYVANNITINSYFPITWNFS